MITIQPLRDLRPCLPFALAINADPCLGDPMLRSQEQLQINLLSAQDKASHQAFGAYEGERLAGLFVFLILPDERYIEMLAGLTREPAAWEAMLAHLRAQYPSCQADFVYNPKNAPLRDCLRAAGADFDPEQQKMILARTVDYRTPLQTILYTPAYREQYARMHSTDVYWTADKILAAPERFRVILALDGQKVVGYLDVTYCFEENQPYDIFVLPGYRNRGYAKAMLARAVALNRPKGMSLLVDADNAPAVAAYAALGFERVENANSITASLRL